MCVTLTFSASNKMAISYTDLKKQKHKKLVINLNENVQICYKLQNVYMYTLS